MPARAPASIDMLAIVIRPSIDRPRAAAPVYSITWPAAPSVPIWPIVPRIMSLAVQPGPELAGVVDPHRLGPPLGQRLGRQHVLDLARADAERERAERAVGGGVGVAADDRHARLGQAELRADHVHDPVAAVPERIQADAELGAVAVERLELRLRELVGIARAGGDVVVGGGHRAVGPAHAPAGRPQPLERLRARHLVHQMQVDEQQVVADHVIVPDLLEQGARRLWHGGFAVYPAADLDTLAWCCAQPVGRKTLPASGSAASAARRWPRPAQRAARRSLPTTASAVSAAPASPPGRPRRPATPPAPARWNPPPSAGW